ncbi:IS1595 family transposase [Sphingomonas flavalba]|uniref:IS1595 family transposase n=1 Tax=Sphingomonas flavalba TaxID=2559804 RepID=UPI00109E0739|nr:IS1595 family transposase [Sphingomonas flavalba]
MTNITDPIYTNEEAARAHFEAIRWPDGRVCPHCGTIGNSTLMQGKTTRAGLYKCKDCRKPFTATMGTVYERSHIPLHKWLLATHLMVSSKKGISAHQLFRMLGFGSYRTAWFMAHRIREAMRSDDVTPMGSGGGTVEVDETFIGRVKGAPKKRAFHHKMKVLALVDRDSGQARTIVIDNVNASTLMPLVVANVAREAKVMTDEHSGYRYVSSVFAAHGTTSHGRGEYVNLEDRSIHSNTVEGYFSIFKRGMKGVYQHCGEQHLHRYLREFDFRYSNRGTLGVSDQERATIAVQGTVGKRLTYARPDRSAAA